MPDRYYTYTGWGDNLHDSFTSASSLRLIKNATLGNYLSRSISNQNAIAKCYVAHASLSAGFAINQASKSSSPTKSNKDSPSISN